MTTKMQERYEKREKAFYRAYSLVLVICAIIAYMTFGMPLTAHAGMSKHISRTRTATGQVIDYSPKDSIVYIETSDGNVWMISEADFEIGDIVSVKFNTNGTKKKQDDSILRVYYKGYCDFMIF